MNFDPKAYGSIVSGILALDGDGERLMPLASGQCSSSEAFTRIETTSAETLFPNSRAPEAALAGLYLYFSCLDRAHEIAQSVDSVEGSYWHGILHRQEPDSANARYWFRRVGTHLIFSELGARAASIADRYPALSPAWTSRWEPSEFVEICERARQRPGSSLERMAIEIQRAEWQLLFDYCACVGSVAV